MKSVRIPSYSGPHFPAFGLNMERYGVSLRIQSACGKMRTRITPNPDSCFAVALLLCSNVLHFFKKMQTSVKMFCWPYAISLFFYIMKHTMVKLHKTLEITANTNKLLPAIIFCLFQQNFWTLHKRNKNSWKLHVLFFKSNLVFHLCLRLLREDVNFSSK